MALFENFPYTNLHELNMEWIVKICKELFEKYPDLEALVNKKLNKPATNPNGNNGDILLSNGDGSTRWEALSISFVPIIVNAVNDWLSDHPEATTTVLDGSLTLAKFTDYLAYLTTKKQSGCILPIYLGDYLSDNNHIPSAVIINGSDVYTFDAPGRDYATAEESGVGIIKKFDLASNRFDSETLSLVGHANSVAFDGTNYFIAPIWQYDSNGETPITKIYEYTSSMTYVGEINTPAVFTGISYDPITGKLYGYQNAGVYIFDNGAFQYYCTIHDYPWQEDLYNNRYYNQDFAVYDNQFYISSPYGNILHGLLEEYDSYITDSYYVANLDSTGRYILGELEGMEFDANGHLFASMYTTIPGNLKDAFVVELPVNQVPQFSTGILDGTFGSADGTLTLSESTQEMFSLRTYHIRSINQLHCRRVGNSGTVLIPDGENVVDPYEIRISEDIELRLQGHYTCVNITVFKGNFSIRGDMASHLLTLTGANQLIRLTRSGMLSIEGGYALRVDAPNITSNQDNNFIYVADYHLLTNIRLGVTEINSKVLKIGTTILIADELFIGTRRMTRLPDSYEFRVGYGVLTNSAKRIMLYFTSPLILPATFSVSGTALIRAYNGYLEGNSSGIDLSDPTYSVSWYRRDDYTWMLQIEKADASAFTGLTNNSVVNMCVSILTMTAT